ncbi:hypothetical protein RvY_14212 [Ramazzottius varieornatus]|uniref:Uncharacterized protein n=1 Tax=Ramazzottius varieornatus TaxID=947166 RepID=A0A1D1VQI2_RAMVA|nr:hypothetical protein RvY_14212 [Ramazzottius varieornatus]
MDLKFVSVPMKPYDGQKPGISGLRKILEAVIAGRLRTLLEGQSLLSDRTIRGPDDEVAFQQDLQRVHQ